MRIPYPKWADDPALSPDELRKMRLRFLIFRAALQITAGPEMLPALASRMGVSAQCLHGSISRGYVTPQVASAVEQACDGEVTRGQLLALD